MYAQIYNIVMTIYQPTSTYMQPGDYKQTERPTLYYRVECLLNLKDCKPSLYGPILKWAISHCGLGISGIIISGIIITLDIATSTAASPTHSFISYHNNTYEGTTNRYTLLEGSSI